MSATTTAAPVTVATGLIVTAMTWLVMPTLVRLLAGWLYPAEREP